MKNFTICLLSLFVCLLLFTGCGSKNGADQPASDTTEGGLIQIDIAKTTGFIGEEEYYKLREKDPAFCGSFSRTMPVMNPADRKKYQIDNMPISEEYTIYGKLIHQADTWRMESILGYVEDHMLTEYLVIYDKNDNYVSCLKAASNQFYTGDIDRVEIVGDKITRINEWYDEDGGEKTCVQYQITPLLAFKEVKQWKERI